MTEPTLETEFETITPEAFFQQCSISTRVEQARILREMAYDIENGTMAASMVATRCKGIVNLSLHWYEPSLIEQRLKDRK